MDPTGSPRLAPGLRVVRRGLHHLQVGLYDGRRTLLPRTPAVEHTLAALLGGTPLDPGPESHEVLDLLERHGCLADQQPHRHARVSLHGETAEAGDLFAGTGVDVVAEGAEADVALVVSHGELDRERLDPFLRNGTSHVVVRLVDGAALVGPFVVPGLTACLRCIDAHLSVQDPDHVAVTSRYVRATARARADGVPDLSDPLLTRLAIAWAARDVVAHLGGSRPATWSRTLLLDADPSRRIEQDWSRHPQCGCCWSAHAPSQAP